MKLEEKLMKTTCKWISLIVAVMMAMTLVVAPVSAASTATRVWDDWESYADSSDVLYYIGIQKRNKAVVAVNLDTNSVLGGKNCIKVDYDNNNTPGYATFWHEPDQDTRGLEKLVSTTDGFKITMACTGKLYVRLRLSFSWSDYGNDIFLKVDTTPKTYTVRWKDAFTADMLKQMEEATEFSRLEMVIYNQENEGLTFNNTVSGSLYFDDFLFFQGDDATDKMDSIGYLGVNTGKSAIGGNTTERTDTDKQNNTGTDTGKQNGTSKNSSTATNTDKTPENSNTVSGTEEEGDIDIESETVDSSTIENPENSSLPADDSIRKSTEHRSAWIWIVIAVACAAAAAAAIVCFVLKKKKQTIGVSDTGELPTSDEETISDAAENENSPEE